MNTPIARLFALVLLLFAALVAFTSRWSFFEAEALRDNPKNRRALIEELQVKRGTIRAADGTLLARSEPAGAGTYRRVYTEAARDVAHVIGFSDIDLGRAGIERSRNDELSGDAGALDDLAEQFRGGVERGDDVRLSIDLGAQQAALDGLNGRKGSVVAIEPATGRVRAINADTADGIFGREAGADAARPRPSSSPAGLSAIQSPSRSLSGGRSPAVTSRPSAFVNWKRARSPRSLFSYDSQRPTTVRPDSARSAGGSERWSSNS